MCDEFKTSKKHCSMKIVQPCFLCFHVHSFSKTHWISFLAYYISVYWTSAENLCLSRYCLSVDSCAPVNQDSGTTSVTHALTHYVSFACSYWMTGLAPDAGRWRNNLYLHFKIFINLYLIRSILAQSSVLSYKLIACFRSSGVRMMYYFSLIPYLWPAGFSVFYSLWCWLIRYSL